jgi:hypothetical protein
VAEDNRYRPPQAEVRDVDHDAQLSPQSDALMRGQKRMIYAILVEIGAVILNTVVNVSAGPSPQVSQGLAALAGIAALGLSVSGLFLVSRGLRINPVMRGVLVLFMVIPLINIITILVVNARATRALRRAGFHVGFLGVSR